MPLGAFLENEGIPECTLFVLERNLLPLARAELLEGPSNERSLILVIELDVSERESSIPRGRDGAIVYGSTGSVRVAEDLERSRKRQSQEIARGVPALLEHGLVVAQFVILYHSDSS